MTRFVIVQAMLFFAYAGLNTAAMVAIKESRASYVHGKRGHATVRVIAGGMLYAMAILVLVTLLKRGDASSVYPVAIGCTVIAAILVGARLYAERLTIRKAIGTAILIAGITVMFWDASTA